MAFDFPASPTEGAVFTPSGGPTYTYKGGRWLLAAGTAVFALATALAYNKIVNGSMQISQENGNTASAAPNNYFPADMFWAGVSITGAYSLQRVQSVTPAGATDRLRMTVTTGGTTSAGTTLNVQTAIEGFNTADLKYGVAGAVQSVLRFGWKSPAGTYAVCVRNALNDRSYAVPFTISAGQANTDTLQTLVIPGDVTGTWEKTNGRGPNILWTMAGGSTGVTGWQAGNINGHPTNRTSTTAGDVFELFDVGFYADPDNTGLAPPFELPDYASELARCQRYWEKQSGVGTLFCGNVTSAIAYTAAGRWLVQKRVIPVITGVNNYASGFPAAIGTLSTSNGGQLFYESRTASGTATGAQFNSDITGNARM